MGYMSNPFFKNYGPFEINELLKKSNVKINEKFKNVKIFDIKDLYNSTSKDITFFHSKKYSDAASKTNANFCITTNVLKDFLPKNCTKIIVDNVLISTSLITKLFYPDSVTDDFDTSVRI